MAHTVMHMTFVSPPEKCSTHQPLQSTWVGGWGYPSWPLPPLAFCHTSLPRVARLRPDMTIGNKGAGTKILPIVA